MNRRTKSEEFWTNVSVNIKKIIKLSSQFKDLYLNMVEYKEDKRYKSIESIFTDPWLENMQFNNEDYLNYENTMRDLEKLINEDNETLEGSNDNNVKQGFRSGNIHSNDKIFFNEDWTVKY